MTTNRNITLLMAVVIVSCAFACSGSKPSTTPSQSAQPQKTQAQPNAPAALPNTAFKAEISLVDPPAKLRAGQKETVRVKVKNASNEVWWARGAPVNTRPDNRFYIATGDRWLKADGSLVTDMDGRYGLGKDLRPGEETEVPLGITAPKDPGEYTLEVDLVQEQVAWFHEKGSPTAKVKITVVK